MPERLDRSCEQLAAEREVPMSFVQALHQSLGFAPPEPNDRAGEDDATMLEVAALFGAARVGDDATLRLLAVYADSLRRIAKAEADYYEANIERHLRAKGLDERQLVELGTQFGDQAIGILERVLLMIYRRHREHIWNEHAINHRAHALIMSRGGCDWRERTAPPLRDLRRCPIHHRRLGVGRARPYTMGQRAARRCADLRWLPVAEGGRDHHP